MLIAANQASFPYKTWLVFEQNCSQKIRFFPRIEDEAQNGRHELLGVKFLRREAQNLHCERVHCEDKSACLVSFYHSLKFGGRVFDHPVL